MAIPSGSSSGAFGTVCRAICSFLLETDCALFRHHQLDIDFTLIGTMRTTYLAFSALAGLVAAQSTAPILGIFVMPEMTAKSGDTTIDGAAFQPLSLKPLEAGKSVDIEVSYKTKKWKVSIP